MRFDVLTLHPEMVTGPLSSSILGRAAERGLVEIVVHDIREHGHGRHRSVDDTPYGGGAGMVLRIDVLVDAIEAGRTPASRVVLLTPQGRRFDQRQAQRLAQVEHLVLLCGHYEGFDARVEAYVDEMISLGDFVLSGGEIPALAIIDAVARLIPGTLGNADSIIDESHLDDRLDYPHYTRPETVDGRSVPATLLSGDHGAVSHWRRREALRRTYERRPDLLTRRTLTEAERKLLGEILGEAP